MAVGLVHEFDGITVSNEELQNRYGGEVIYHARDHRKFHPSKQLTKNSRQNFGIPLNKRVVLFFGTGRKHKGLVDVAQAIASLERDDIVFVLAGDMHEPGLADQIKTVSNCQCVFLEMQHFDDIASVVAIADICILSQDVKSPISEFQLPAKLTDALAMGIVVIAEKTPPLNKFIQAGVVVDSRGSLADTLKDVLDHFEAHHQEASMRRKIFLKFLTTEVNAKKLERVVKESANGSVGFEANITNSFGDFPFQ